MKSRINRRMVTRLAGGFACGAMVAGGCYGTVDAPGFSGVFSRGLLSIDFPGGYIEADKHGLWVDAPGLNVDIRRNHSNRHDDDDD